MERSSLHARRERLQSLLPRVEPVTFASMRVVPVASTLEPLLEAGGLIRGTVVACQGPTALSVALATVAAATAAGSWLVAVGVPSLGLRAASEVGVALERLVMIADAEVAADDEHVGAGGGVPANDVWATTMSALIDGFDLILLRNDPLYLGHRGASATRRLQARLQARGAVMVIVGDPGHFACDVTITGSAGAWEGLGHGDGRLVRRRLELSAVGRRSPRARRVEVWLPGASGGIEPVRPIASSDPMIPVVAEQRAAAAAPAFLQTG